MMNNNFILRAKQIHENKYDYSKVNYVNNHTKVCIICPEHGEFWQRPSNHLSGSGCPKCAKLSNGKNRRFILEQFIKKAKEVHGDKYDYSKVNYINSRTKVCIICPEHGEFWQTSGNHLQGAGCKKCATEKTTLMCSHNINWFIKKAKEVHGDEYDYSKVEYKNLQTKVCIICPEHGEFWQTPTAHIYLKEGCPKCTGGYRYTKEQFIKKAKEVHGDEYDYSKVEYMNAYTKVCIICPEHGEFWQKPYSHLEGYGCRKCADNYRKEMLLLSQDEIIQRFKKVHGDKYDYSKVRYKGVDTKVCIICPEHGEFWQTPTAHIYLKEGCPKCRKSLMENEISILFDNNNIKYETQYTFNWLNSDITKYLLRLDFYLPDYNIAIECQGGQHFYPVDYFGGENEFEKIIERDKQKNKKCIENKVELFYYIPQNYEIYVNNNSIYKKENIFYNSEDILNYIQNINRLL